MASDAPPAAEIATEASTTEDLDWRTNNVAGAVSMEEQVSSAADDTLTSNDLNSSGMQESSSNDSKTVETQPPTETTETVPVSSQQKDETIKSEPVNDNPSTAMVTSDPPATAKIEESPQVDTTPDEPTKQLQSIDSTVQMTKQETTQKARQVQRSVSGDEPQQQFSISQPNTAAVTVGVGVDPEFEQIKQRVREMEQEAERLKAVQHEIDSTLSPSRHVPVASPFPQHAHHAQQGLGSVFPSLEEKIEADARSIYVGQIEYHCTAEEVEEHFRGCGALNRVTILCDRWTGHPKGYGYIEFADKDSVETAMALDGSLLKGRSIKVMPKRTNKPGISNTDRGRPPFRARGRGRGSHRGRGAPAQGYGVARGAPGGYMARPRGSFRGRGAFAPY